MLNFLDVYERTLEGPVISEKEFYMQTFVPALRGVIKNYGIKFDIKNPVPCDDAAADNLYHAAVDFFSRVGVYCTTTNRIIHFSKAEILEAVKEAPGKCYIGEGKDAGVFDMRRPDDPKVPWFNVGWSCLYTSEEIATNVMEALATIPGSKALDISAANTLRGVHFPSGSPGEMYAAIRQVKIGREAARRAGRPGLGITNCIGTASAGITTIAASAPQFGLRPSDAWLVAILSEMKVDYDVLNKIAYLLAWGANIGPESGPTLGGYCGGPEGTAVVCTACSLVGLLVHKGSFHMPLPMDLQHSCNTTSGMLMAMSSFVQASSRNIPIPLVPCGYMAAGPNTKMYFHEAAAFLVACITSGSAGIGMPIPARGIKIDGGTPMEHIFKIEMGSAAARLDREKANELVIQLLEKYESHIPTAPEGDRYQDCYDVQTAKPLETYVRLYDEVKEELAKMGVPF
jgi:methylamine--corrinoid protein Co-methyltransferase